MRKLLASVAALPLVSGTLWAKKKIAEADPNQEVVGDFRFLAIKVTANGRTKFAFAIGSSNAEMATWFESDLVEDNEQQCINHRSAFVQSTQKMTRELQLVMEKAMPLPDHIFKAE